MTPQRFTIVCSPYIARYSSIRSSEASFVAPYIDRKPDSGNSALMPGCRPSSA